MGFEAIEPKGGGRARVLNIRQRNGGRMTGHFSRSAVREFAEEEVTVLIDREKGDILFQPYRDVGVPLRLNESSGAIALQSLSNIVGGLKTGAYPVERDEEGRMIVRGAFAPQKGEAK